MKKLRKFTTLFALTLMFTSVNIYSCVIGAPTATSVKTKQNTNVAASTTKPTFNEAQYTFASSIDIVNNPKEYLNKKVKINAKFDKFSTLGLDYKPAFRDSKNYISFLIQRDDVKDHIIPLSEMKIFIKRSEAEKFIDLESNDKIVIYGKVFSDALGDPWVDVEKLTVLSGKSKINNKK